MHPSSFYDLQARYIYSPLHGPYSLSEALEGLISYPLSEPQDSISIGSKRSLRHELISELSNVVDDLQSYLIYFSSQFLISPSNSPDLLKELRASHDGFRYLSICWGAIIMRIAIARGIVEHNIWPHLFRPAINNLTAYQRCPSFTLPDAQWGKSAIPVSRFVLPPRWDSIPSSANPLSDTQHLPFAARSERPQIPPSKTDPTVGRLAEKTARRLWTSTHHQHPLNHTTFELHQMFSLQPYPSSRAFHIPTKMVWTKTPCRQNRLSPHAAHAA